MIGIPFFAALVISAQAAPAAPSEPLSLEELVALADRRNAEMVALRRELDELRAADLKAPRGADRTPATPGSVEDLELRIRNGLLSAADARLEHRRVVLAAKVRSAFARYSAGRALRKLSEDSALAATETLRLAEQRRAQGRESSASVEHARLALARSRQESAAIEQRLSQSLLELFVLVNTPANGSLVLKGALPQRSIVVEPSDSLVAHALRDRADLRAARSDYETALDAQSLAARNAPRPNTPAPRSRGFASSPDQGESPEAVITSADVAVRSLQDAIRFDVALSEARVRNANAAVAASVNIDLALVAEDRKLFLDAYRDGTMPLSQVLSALRDAYEVRRQEVLALEDLADADADLRRAVGDR